MAEEHTSQSQESRLCANNCGLFGSQATLNLCSKCYRDFHLKEQEVSSTAAVKPSLTAAAPFSTSLSSPLQDVAGDGRDSATATPTAPTNRCSACRRRVGLTGFTCRCGTTFCGSHRYPEQHGCIFDFKGVEREAMAKANPVVKAEKLEKV